MRDAWSGIGRSQPNPIVCGHRFCAICGRWRHVCDFSPNDRNTRSGLNSYCRACVCIKHRERRARRTEEQLKLDREYQRIWCEAKRREAGIQPRVLKRPTVIDQVERILLPREPLLYALAGYLEDGNTILDLERESGIPGKTIRRLITGESERARIDVADKLAMAFGLHLSLLYPDGEAA